MATTYQSLLVGNADGWHDGDETITYSFIGAEVPAYYRERDLDGDGTNDAWRVGNGKFASMTEGVSMTPTERALVSLAVEAWNEVAEINLVPGSITGSAGDDEEGSPITGSGTLVAAGGVAVPTNDDGYASYDFSAVFEDGINFFGNTYDATSLWVNTNGSVSFASGISTYTPTSITSGSTPMIAPFWGDVDTRAGSPIYVDVDETTDVVTVTWGNVGYFSQHTDLTNSFQLQLFDRGGGDFDMVFRYGSINWTTGDASGGEDGLGGQVAHAGFSAGNGADYFELPQSGSQSGMLGLEATMGNTGASGLWVFEVRNGIVAGDIVFGSSEIMKLDGSVRTGLYGFVSKFPNANKLGENPTMHGDTWVNSGNPKQDVSAYGHTSWQTYLHEIGHSLGLHHPNEDPNNKAGDATNNNQFTVMSYKPHPSEVGENITNKAWPLTPMVYDIRALQKLYGANFTTRTTDTTYFGDSDGTTALEYQYAADGMKVTGSDAVARDVILTIWDAGGTDLIDASDLTTKSWIDLRPGKYSTIGSEANNIAVATAVKKNGVVVNYIENADGGTKNDTLLGNKANNELSGNGGKDHIEARGGNDTLNGGDGADVLFGEIGADELYGGKGADSLLGGKGRDILFGENGNDKLWGEAGQDHFVLLDGEGRDRIKDFQDDVDTLILDKDLWGGAVMTAQAVVNAFGSISNGNALLSFADGERFIVEGLTNTNALVDDISFV